MFPWLQPAHLYFFTAALLVPDLVLPTEQSVTLKTARQSIGPLSDTPDRVLMRPGAPLSSLTVKRGTERSG